MGVPGSQTPERQRGSPVAHVADCTGRDHFCAAAGFGPRHANLVAGLVRHVGAVHSHGAVAKSKRVAVDVHCRGAIGAVYSAKGVDGRARGHDRHNCGGHGDCVQNNSKTRPGKEGVVCGRNIISVCANCWHSVAMQHGRARVPSFVRFAVLGLLCANRPSAAATVDCTQYTECSLGSIRQAIIDHDGVDLTHPLMRALRLHRPLAHCNDQELKDKRDEMFPNEPDHDYPPQCESSFSFTDAESFLTHLALVVNLGIGTSFANGDFV